MHFKAYELLNQNRSNRNEEQNFL